MPPVYAWTAFLAFALILCAVTFIFAVTVEKGLVPKRAFSAFARKPLVEIAFVALVVGGFIHHGATKTNGGRGVETQSEDGGRLRSLPQIEGYGHSGTNDLSSVTNLCFIGMAPPSDDSVAFSVAWPANWSLPESALMLYARHDLDTGGWERLAAVQVPDSANAVDVEVPLCVLPEGGAKRAFFAVGTLHDTDGDGLADSDERFLYRTDPGSNDTDGDLVPDGAEVARGTDPLSGDTDGDGIDDCHESGGMTRDPSPDVFHDGSVIVDLTAQMFANTQICVDVALQCPVDALGESFSRVAIDPNGLVVLHNGGEMSLPARPQCQDMRFAQFPSNTFAIAGCWAELSLSTNEPASSVRLVAGMNPIVEYSNMRLASASSTEDNLVSFQIWLPIAGIPFGTLIYQISGSEVDGRRASVGMCGRNGAFRTSYCFRDPGRIIDGMVLYADPGYGTDPLNPDSDFDGIDDGVELSFGTDPLQPDTDGDGLADGWEVAHGLNPLSSSGDDGAAGDPDGDGLVNIVEYLNNSNPQNQDSDSDGVGDLAEVEGDSDPNDADDRGEPLATNLFKTLTFNIDGDYAAWEMSIEGLGPFDMRVRRISMGYPHAVQDVPLKVRKGNKYRLSMRWLNSNGHAKPDWYCWQAKINGLPTEKTYNDYSTERKFGVADVVRGDGWVVDNEEGLLTDHVHQRNGNGGNVAGRKTATLYVLDVDMSICDPSGAAWSELDESRVLLDSEQLRIKSEIRPRLSSLEECRRLLGDSLKVCTAGTCPEGAELTLETGALFENLNDRSVLKVWRTRNQLKSLGLLPENDNDGVDEMSWIDIAETSGQSYADSEAFSDLGYQFRGMATSDNTKTLEATPPNSVPSESFFKAAGCEVVTAEYCGFTSPRRQIMNQADYFYFSGHGSHATGTIQGGFTPAMASQYWNRDLDCAIIAGCAVLDVRNYRFNSLGLLYRWKHKEWKGTYPGEIWEGTGVKYLLGYALKAPLDTDGGSSIASAFVSNIKSGKDIIASWRDANDTAKGRNACVIDCSKTPHQFWFWNGSSGNPVWTMKEKGTVSW